MTIYNHCRPQLCMWAYIAKTKRLAMFQIKIQSSTSLSLTKVPLLLDMNYQYSVHLQSTVSIYGTQTLCH